MKTEIRDRKTPHAVTANLYGGQSTDMVWAWCFENGEVNDRLVKKYIPMSRVYVAPNTQDVPDDKFRKIDLRKVHVDVWNEKVKNFDRHGKFMVNYELREHSDRSNLNNFLE